MAGKYRFSFGPWNIHPGADPFGPVVVEAVLASHKSKKWVEVKY